MSNAIAIPVKRLVDAKTRLSEMLTSKERSLLVTAMFQDVLTAAKHCSRVDRVLVVTPDEAVAHLTAESGAEVLLEGQNDGLNQAVKLGVDRALKLRMKRLLILHADLPLVRPKDLASFFQRDHEVIIAPSHMRDGTNAMSLTPPDAIRSRYGRMSFDTHLALARSMGFEPLVIWNRRIALDIDVSRDLKILCGLHPAGFTGAFFQDSGIAERLEYIAHEPVLPPKLSARTQLVAGPHFSNGESPVLRRGRPFEATK